MTQTFDGVSGGFLKWGGTLKNCWFIYHGTSINKNGWNLRFFCQPASKVMVFLKRQKRDVTTISVGFYFSIFQGVTKKKNSLTRLVLRLQGVTTRGVDLRILQPKRRPRNKTKDLQEKSWKAGMWFRISLRIPGIRFSDNPWIFL